MILAAMLAAIVGWTGLEPESQLAGRRLSEGYMQGKVALVCRWSLDSAEGREAVARLQRVWQSYKSKPFVALGSLIGGAGDAPSAKSFAKREGITLPLYREAGLEDGAPVFAKSPWFYVLDATGRLSYKGTDERLAEERVVLALTDYAAPPDAAYWRRLIDSEIDVLPGRAYMHIVEFRKRFPAAAADYDESFAALKARSEVVKMAQLEAFSAKAKDFDPGAGKAELRSLLLKISTTVRAYEPFKGHPDAAVVQEAKNCLADLKWAEAAINAHVKKN